MVPLLRLFLLSHISLFSLCSFQGAIPPYAFACSCFFKETMIAVVTDCNLEQL
jgi:hypothetical protein